MNEKPKKLISVDRLLLLAVLIFQIIIIFRYISPDRAPDPAEPASDRIESNDQTDPESSSSDHVRMRLPLPPGYRERKSNDINSPNINDVFSEMHQEMNEMMRRAQMDFDRIDDLMRVNDDWNRVIKSPSMDIKERKDRYIVAISIPGGTATNVSITLDDRMLSIRSQYEMQDTMGKSSQRFVKRVLLPSAVDNENVTRTVSDDGILLISIMKKKRTDNNNIDDNEKKEL